MSNVCGNDKKEEEYKDVSTLIIPEQKVVKRTRISKKQAEKIKLAQNSKLETDNDVNSNNEIVTAAHVHTSSSNKDDDNTLEIINDNNINNEILIDEPKVYKKRGRKPKGGKIIVNPIIKPYVSLTEHNIILHLKCTNLDISEDSLLSTIKYDPTVQNVETFQFENLKTNDLGFDIIHTNEDDDNNNIFNQPLKHAFFIESDPNLKNSNINNPIINPSNSINTSNIIQNNSNNNNTNSNNEHLKYLWLKIKELSLNLHNNNLMDKKSDCFWCTCGFDNPPIYIPKYELNGTYHCYGCFCSPECATSFLFKESIDVSTRFERYHLLNHIYCKIYNYSKNIKPAPDPYYTLNKYYGNLTIQEYRTLLKNERLLIVVEKPLSIILPELHEDNEELMYNSKSVIAANKFSLKKKTLNTKNKMNEQFTNSK
jgi:hypothetical protein